MDDRKLESYEVNHLLLIQWILAVWGMFCIHGTFCKINALQKEQRIRRGRKSRNKTIPIDLQNNFEQFLLI